MRGTGVPEQPLPGNPLGRTSRSSTRLAREPPTSGPNSSSVPGIEWPYGFMAFNGSAFRRGHGGRTALLHAPRRPSMVSSRRSPGARVSAAWFCDPHRADDRGRPARRPCPTRTSTATSHCTPPTRGSSDVYPAGGADPAGPGSAADNRRRAVAHDGWDELLVMADPGCSGRMCQPGPNASDAEALAQSIRIRPRPRGDRSCRGERRRGRSPDDGRQDCSRNDRVIESPAPTEGGPPAVLWPIFRPGPGGGLRRRRRNGPRNGRVDPALPVRHSQRARPCGSCAAESIAPEDRSFERAVEAAAPVVNSVEFHAP